MAPRTQDVTRPTAGLRRAGYVITVVLDLVLLWVVYQIDDRGWFPFLTDAFEDVLPFLAISLVASAVVNAVWIGWDPPWLKHLAQTGLLVVSIVVIARIWQVFPFDFSGYAAWWSALARFAIGMALIGTFIGTIAEVVHLVRAIGPAAPARQAGRAGERP